MGVFKKAKEKVDQIVKEEVTDKRKAGKDRRN
jgi:hypothetical protein